MLLTKETTAFAKDKIERKAQKKKESGTKDKTTKYKREITQFA